MNQGLHVFADQSAVMQAWVYLEARTSFHKVRQRGIEFARGWSRIGQYRRRLFRLHLSGSMGLIDPSQKLRTRF